MGLPLTDRFSKQFYEYFQSTADFENESLQSMLAYFKKHDILSTVTANSTSNSLQFEKVTLRQFFMVQNNDFKYSIMPSKPISVSMDEYVIQQENFILNDGSVYFFNSACMLFLLIGSLLFIAGKIKLA